MWSKLNHTESKLCLNCQKSVNYESKYKRLAIYPKEEDFSGIQGGQNKSGPHAKQLPNDLSKIPIKPAVYYGINFSSSHIYHPDRHFCLSTQCAAPKWIRMHFSISKAINLE